jgi:hypothetical protein
MASKPARVPPNILTLMAITTVVTFIALMVAYQAIR